MAGGLYLIVNNINGKCYTGQTNDFKRRNHYQSANYPRSREYNSPLCRAIRKYGWENFSKYTFEIPFEFRDDGERILIEMYNCLTPNGYNIEPGGCKNKTASEETIIKMRAASRLRWDIYHGLIKKPKPKKKYVNKKILARQQEALRLEKEQEALWDSIDRHPCKPTDAAFLVTKYIREKRRIPIDVLYPEE